MSNIAEQFPASYSISSTKEISKWNASKLNSLKDGAVHVISRGENSTYNVKWDAQQSKFEVSKAKGSVIDWVKSSFSHGIFRGHLHNRAVRIQKALNDIESASLKGHQASSGKKQTSVNPNIEPFDLVGGQQISSVDLAELIRPENGRKNDRDEPPRVFLYGFSKKRQNLSEHLQDGGINKHAKLEVIDDYNKQIGLGDRMDAGKYVTFLNDVRTKNLENKLSKKDIQKSASEYPGQSSKKIEWQEKRAAQWAGYLQRDENPKRLDLSRKFADPNEQKRMLEFVVKNFGPMGDDVSALGNDPKGIRDALFQISKGSVEDSTFEAFQSVFAYMHGIGSDKTPSEKMQDFNKLSEAEQRLVDFMINAAFFRQTSKMGLEFAKDSGAVVCFSWRDVTGNADVSALQQNLSAKKWKANYGSINSKYSEPITYSEMRHLDRLTNKLKNPPKVIRFNE